MSPYSVSNAMNLASTRMLLSNSAFSLQRYSSRPLTTRYQPWRSYALSRFSNRRATGAGRSRETVKSANPPLTRQRPDNPQPLEDTPSDDESRMWHTAQRPPTSNSQEGLQRLLMQNDTLIIERYSDILHFRLSVTLSMIAQTNRDAQYFRWFRTMQ